MVAASFRWVGCRGRIHLQNEAGADGRLAASGIARAVRLIGRALEWLGLVALVVAMAWLLACPIRSGGDPAAGWGWMPADYATSVAWGLGVVGGGGPALGAAADLRRTGRRGPRRAPDTAWVSALLENLFDRAPALARR